MPEMLLTVEQAAERLQLLPETVRNQLARGALRGFKRGRVWRVPESALLESREAPATPTTNQVEAIWREMTSGDAGRHAKALQTLFKAPDRVQAVVMQRSADAAAQFYATAEGEAELADWRAVQGEDFAGFEDEEQREAA